MCEEALSINRTFTNGGEKVSKVFKKEVMAEQKPGSEKTQRIL